MEAWAVEVGTRLVEAERALGALFRSEEADHARVREATDRVARLRGELQAVHLVAHLETRVLLSTGQVQRYDRLRGYGG